MWDFIHVWHARHGVPDTDRALVELNDRLAQRREDDECLPLKVLIEEILSCHSYASIEPIVNLDVDNFPLDGGAAFDEETMQLWQRDPMLAYERSRPAALRLRLAGSMVEFYPRVYEILKFCRSSSLVAVRGQPWWPACWQPFGFETGRGPFVGEAPRNWSGLEAVLELRSAATDASAPDDVGTRVRDAVSARSPAAQAPALRPTWAIVARQLESAFAPHGFTGWANLNGSNYGELKAWFARKTPAGEQRVTWRMALVGGEGAHRSQELCMRMGIGMGHDGLRGSFYSAMPMTSRSDLFACELSEFMAPAKPDTGGLLFMANRDEWGPDSERVSVEEPGNLLRILSILKNHALPFLDRCTTPIATLEAMCEAGYPFLDHPLPMMVLAWHVQDLGRYEELKVAFRQRMKHEMSAEDFAHGARKLEAVPPLFVT